MTIWNGLWKKEWHMMRGWFYGTLLGSVAISFILPLLLTYFFEWKFTQLDMELHFIPLIWMVFTVFIPLSIAVTSINMELERPDVWLHTPASIFQLFGVKVVYAITVGLLNMTVTTILFLFYLRLTDGLSQVLSISELLAFVVHFLLMLSFITWIIVIVGLFFRIIHLLFKQLFGSSAIIIVIILFIAFMAAIDWITKTALYTKISTIGSLQNVPNRELLLGNGESSLFVGGEFFYVGELFMTYSFMGLLFIATALLFEKKVRL